MWLSQGPRGAPREVVSGQQVEHECPGPGSAGEGDSSSSTCGLAGVMPPGCAGEGRAPRLLGRLVPANNLDKYFPARLSHSSRNRTRNVECSSPGQLTKTRPAFISTGSFAFILSKTCYRGCLQEKNVSLEMGAGRASQKKEGPGEESCRKRPFSIRLASRNPSSRRRAQAGPPRPRVSVRERRLCPQCAEGAAAQQAGAGVTLRPL